MRHINFFLTVIKTYFPGLAFQPFDGYNFIWKNSLDAGYRTYYAEDSPQISTFNYGKAGFHEPPCDYYHRALSLAMEYNKVIWNIKSQVKAHQLGVMLHFLAFFFFRCYFFL